MEVDIKNQNSNRSNINCCNFKPLAIFYSCTAQFVLDLVGNPEDRFSHDIRGIKHDFPFINIRKVPREVLKIEGEARGFQPPRGTLWMLMNDKIMFDRYYCINSTKHCENEENIDALYFIT